MVGDVVLFYAPGEDPAPAVVLGVELDPVTQGERVRLMVLGAVRVPVPAADGQEWAPPSSRWQPDARIELVPRGQPGKDAGPFWAPRGRA